MMAREVPPPDDQRHLRWLVICHRIFAVLAVLCGGVYFGYPSFLDWLMTNDRAARSMYSDAYIAQAKISMVILGIAMCVICGLAFFAASCIAKRRSWLFIMVVSGIECLVVPFGTAVAIGTFIVMQRPTVQMLFGRSAPPPRMLG